MNYVDPISKPKSDFEDLVAQISHPDSPVGIDAKYTHALIINYLQEILGRIEKIEKQLDQSN